MTLFARVWAVLLRLLGWLKARHAPIAEQRAKRKQWRKRWSS